ncbi:glycine receptor subunit alphaZ1-like [Centruroides vittatus]|uniref:glycine receptor subunit alphaZ1-like n=1 Tax=Centruroides vittatus TaxID=120091 RepID=UPI00350FAD92
MLSIKPVRSENETVVMDDELRTAILKIGKNVAKLTRGKKSTDRLPVEEPEIMTMTMEVYVDDISSFNAKDMEFRLDVYFKHSWKVNKAICSEYVQSVNSINLNITMDDPLYLSPVYFYLFWLPDTFLINAKKIDTITKESSTKILILSLEPDELCKLEHVSRLAVDVGCQMDFKFYPVDIQICPLTMRSYGYPETMLVYKWENESGEVPMNPDLKLLQHSVKLSKGNGYRIMLGRRYSMLYINFTFERHLSYFVTNVYAPSGLVIVISWFSFWLGNDVVPGRISLCVTCILALITQTSGLRNTLPQVSYINGLDIWMISCLLFVFASLLEFTIIWFIDKHQKDKMAKEEEKPEAEIKNEPPAPYYIDMEKGQGRVIKPYCTCESHKRKQHERLMTQPNKPKWIEEEVEEEEEECSIICNCSLKNILMIDKASRVMFPLCFIIFNTIYWPLLLQRKY